MSFLQFGKASKLIIFAALVCTLLIGLHLSSLSPLAQYQQWRLPTTTPDQDHKEEASSQEPPTVSTPEHATSDVPSHSAPSTSTYTHISTDVASLGALPTTHPSSIVPPCHGLPGSEDVLVIMRTGATEIKDKLPASLNTTFSCYPNYLIFSDYAESFLGYEVHDVLKDLPEDIKAHNEDFSHYRHVHEVGRTGLDVGELSGEVSEDSGAVGKTDNPGWTLDKWKFLPMINQTFEMSPDRKWYIFVETDTYLVWSSLLQWIPHIDSSKSYYFGSETMIGDDVFGHGGSAFLISNPALRKGVELYNSKPDYWHEYTAEHWAGDAVLGVLLREAGVELTWSSPMIQGGSPSDIDFESFKGDDTLWCLPAVSYHHLIPSEVKDMWYFEQRYLQTVRDKSNHPFAHWGNDMSTVLHHRDTFKSFVLPNLTSERIDWNNNADERVPDTVGARMEECRGLCEMKDSCRQYTLDSSGCSLSGRVRMGRHDKGVASGWLAGRIQDWMKERDHCEGRDGWLVP